MFLSLYCYVYIIKKSHPCNKIWYFVVVLKNLSVKSQSKLKVMRKIAARRQ